MSRLWRLARPGASLQQLMLGGGKLEHDGRRSRLVVPAIQRKTYADAQIHDYAGLQRSAYRWRPPLCLSVRARMSTEIRGTAGFGFWNNPLAPLGGSSALPRAAWFLLASPPSAMELAHGVPGHGWKAATIDADRPAALAWAPLVLPVLLACRRPAWRRIIWPHVQRALAVDEAMLDLDPSAWHSYQLIWLHDRVIFGVDGRQVLVSRSAPRGPLGLVIWIDNQWARVTPAGAFGWGLLDVPAPQWIEIEDLWIASIAP